MKRIISFLFAFAIFMIAANAQIKDEFWGCKLGVTTKAQLISRLQSQGFKCKVDKENDGFYINDVTYAGEVWEYCTFSFYKNKLQFVGFSKGGTMKKVIGIYDTILENIARKYPQASRTMIVDEASKKNARFDDGKVYLSISYNIKGYGAFATLIYMSKALAVEINKDISNDL